MPVLHTDLPALVLDSRDYGESDKIVVLFCQQIGRMGALAKGAHRSRKRFLNKLELFSFLQITYSKSSPAGLSVLNEAELVNSFISLRTDLARYQTASIIREYLLLSTSETAADDQLFQLALWALHSLNSGAGRKQTLALFLIRLFDLLGYRPDFSTCQGCGIRPADGEAVWFSSSGTMVCRRCGNGSGGSSPLAPGTVQMIAAVQQQPLVRLHRFKPNGALLEQMLELCHRYGRHLFQRDIHSWKWLDG